MTRARWYTAARCSSAGRCSASTASVSPLGSGGFGTVYLAEDTWIDKKVALKVAHRQQGLDFGELLREPRLLASLNHPNIVSVLTAEKEDGIFFIVMEYVPGETLEAIIIREGALDVTRALDYTCQICNALDHAHAQDVIHRDLRPGNVLVTEQGLLKVADFGTSRFLEIAAHGTTVIGSPPYMAPEQFHGKAVFASDIYSLGVSMYQMLTGMLPYETPAPGRHRSADDGRAGVAAARAKPEDPEGRERRHPEGDGAGDRGALSARRRAARRPARGASGAGAARARARRSPPARRRTCPPTCTTASRRASSRSRASAGTATSRCTRARAAARSAARSNDRTGPAVGPDAG